MALIFSKNNPRESVASAAIRVLFIGWLIV